MERTVYCHETAADYIRRMVKMNFLIARKTRISFQIQSPQQMLEVTNRETRAVERAIGGEIEDVKLKTSYEGTFVTLQEDTLFVFLKGNDLIPWTFEIEQIIRFSILEDCVSC